MKRYLIITTTLLLMSASPAFAQDDKADYWFDRLDTNNDDVITKAEMEARWAKRSDNERRRPLYPLR